MCERYNKVKCITVKDITKFKKQSLSFRHVC